MVCEMTTGKEMDLRAILDVEVINLAVRCEVSATNKFLTWATDQQHNWVDGGSFTGKGKEEKAEGGEKLTGCENAGVTLWEGISEDREEQVRKEICLIEICELST